MVAGLGRGELADGLKQSASSPVEFGLGPAFLCCLDQLGGFGKDGDPLFWLGHAVSLCERRKKKRHHHFGTHSAAGRYAAEDKRDSFGWLSDRAETPAAHDVADREP